MKKRSAGLLMFRSKNSEIEVFLVHPGGPFWQKKDLSAWSLPKGEYSEGEDPLIAAKREFEEETGIKPEGEFISLEEIKQPSGKLITAWAFEGDCDSARVRSNTFSLEWPPKSGQVQEFPEIDRAGWFSIEDARLYILKGQLGFIDTLLKRIPYLPKRKSPRNEVGTQPTLF